ncbi:hypothetical protein F4558_004904 [Micromonospora profundi]|nr:hypothetical protein [Micromonospora profundi]
MIRMIENIGYRALSRFVPSASAAAWDCKCEAYSRWAFRNGYCVCSGDCRTVTCVSGPK